VSSNVKSGASGASWRVCTMCFIVSMKDGWTSRLPSSLSLSLSISTLLLLLKLKRFASILFLHSVNYSYDSLNLIKLLPCAVLVMKLEHSIGECGCYDDDGDDDDDDDDVTVAVTVVLSLCLSALCCCTQPCFVVRLTYQHLSKSGTLRIPHFFVIMSNARQEHAQLFSIKEFVYSDF
jgi:hypothetical protein